MIDFPHYFKLDNFYDFLFAFQHTKPFLKGVYSETHAAFGVCAKKIIIKKKKKKKKGFGDSLNEITDAFSFEKYSET